jgi:multiple sugar transport system permease protein
MAVKPRKLFHALLFALFIFLLILPTLFFFFWMISLSLKPDADNLAYPPVFIPSGLTVKNFRSVFETSPFARYAMNSLIVAVGSTGLGLLLGIPAAYGIARSARYGSALFILVARMTPALSYLIPWFILFQRIGLANTYQALILTHLIIGLPLIIWIMIGFFEDVHRELEDAAVIDGCSRFGSFLRVAMPLTRPGIAVSGILAFIFSWNNFIFAVVLAGPRLQTLPVAIFNVLTFEQINWGPLASAALLITSPVLILAMMVQRHIITGLAAGGLKG